MATGWAGDGAVQEQIDATIKDGILRAQPAGAGPGTRAVRGVRRGDPGGPPQGGAGRAPVHQLPGSA